LREYKKEEQRRRGGARIAEREKCFEECRLR
jgi:hypothetical protein